MSGVSSVSVATDEDFAVNEGFIGKGNFISILGSVIYFYPAEMFIVIAVVTTGL